MQREKGFLFLTVMRQISKLYGLKAAGESLAEGLGEKTVCLHSAKVTQQHPETIQDLSLIHI